MNVFRAVRLVVWVTIMTVCAVVLLIYLVASQTILHEATIKSWLKSSNGYVLARDDLLTPSIVSSALQAVDTPTSLVGKDEITQALRTALPPDVLTKKADPIIDNLYNWLDSKRPDLSFSVDTTDVQTAFFQALHDEVTSKVAALPACTYVNTTQDVATGVCRSSFQSPEMVANVAVNQVEQHKSEVLGPTITAADIQLPPHPSLVADIPDYLSYLWTLAIVCGGIFLLLTVILLFGRRFAGLIAVGVSATLAGIALLVGSLLVKAMPWKLDTTQFTGAVAHTALQDVLHRLVTLGGLSMGIGLMAVALGVGGQVWWKHHRK